MPKPVKLFLAVVLVLVVSAGVTACGDDDDDNGGGTGKGGGEIKIGTVGPDSADPVMIQTLQAYEAFQLAYTGLLTYAHEQGDAGATLIPGLAEEVPEPTNGGKTYTFQLRDGLEYSDGTPVKASDFENSIKRLLLLGSVWSAVYSPIIEGTAEFTEQGEMSGDITGIEANDKTGEITINLTEPDTKFLFAVGEVYAAPTPAAKSPAKQLKQPPPGIGPYTLEIPDLSTEFVLTRNPNWPGIEGIPEGNFDTIRGVVTDNITRMTQDVIDGKLDFMTDDPTGDLLTEVRTKYPDRFSQETNPPNVYYNYLNVTIPPFDKQEAREAFNYATDSRALIRIFGGRLQPGCNFLPPGVIGHEEFDCKYGDPDGPPDIEKARELVKQSGYEGEPVTFWTNNKDPRPAIGNYFVDVLNEIGFDAELEVLNQQVYFGEVALERTKSQAGFTNWQQDYPHPGDFIEVLLSTRSLESEATSNFGRVSDPKLDAELDKLRPEDPEDVADEWAALDEYVVNEKAWVVPYGSEEGTAFFSERMDSENCPGTHPVYKNDWLQFCLKD